jgi:Fe-S-cluster containining protein
VGLGRGENIGHVHIFYHIRTLNTIPSASPNPEARIGSGDQLRFACGPDLPCFTVCCSNLDLLLTPPDLLRLQRRLGLSSEQFLARHTERQLRGRAGLPFLFLRMRDDDKKSCPFLTPHGCAVYSDRPLACRLYPLGFPPPAPSIQPAFTPVNVNVSVNVSEIDFRHLAFAESFLLIREPHCQGHAASRLWTVREWLADQCPGEELDRGREFCRGVNSAEGSEL